MKPQLNKKLYQTGVMEAKALADDGVYEISVCSDQPYMRPFGLEILSCNPGAVNMDRFNAKAVPLLFGHDPDQPALGIVESFRLDGSQGIATVRFSKSNPQAVMLEGQVKEGVQKNVSIGYSVDEWAELPTSETPAYVATRYTIFEVSVVTVPADASVGWRSADETVVKAYRDFQASAKDGYEENDLNADTDPLEIPIEDEDASPDEADDPSEEVKMPPDEQMPVDCDDEEKEKSLAVEPTNPPTKATDLEKKDMSEENKANAFAEMSDWAIKNNLTEHLSKWMREGYTLDKAKAEAFDLRANAPKINIPLDVRAPEKVTKADHEELSLARTFNAVAQRGTSALLEEGKEYAKRMNISLAENEAFIPLDKAIFKRTMGIGQANGGANFAGTEYLTAEAALREGSVIGRAGVQILTGVNSLLTLPRVTTGSAFAWQSESGSLNDTDFTTISTQWSPKVATVSIPWSIALDALNQPYAIEDIARTDLMGALIEAFEGGVLAGTGANNQPTGLLNDPLIALVNSGSNGNFDSVRAAAMWSKQRGQHGSQNNFTYIVTPTVFAGAMTRVQFSGSFQPALTVTGPGVGLTNGYTVLNSTFVSTALYTNACVAGDFSKVLSTVFGIKIIRDDWNGLPNATVKLRGILMMDSKARQPLSLVRDVNITG